MTITDITDTAPEGRAARAGFPTSPVGLAIARLAAEAPERLIDVLNDGADPGQLTRAPAGTYRAVRIRAGWARAGETDWFICGGAEGSYGLWYEISDDLVCGRDLEMAAAILAATAEITQAAEQLRADLAQEAAQEAARQDAGLAGIEYPTGGAR